MTGLRKRIKEAIRIIEKVEKIGANVELLDSMQRDMMTDLKVELEKQLNKRVDVYGIGVMENSMKSRIFEIKIFTGLQYKKFTIPFTLNLLAEDYMDIISFMKKEKMYTMGSISPIQQKFEKLLEACNRSEHFYISDEYFYSSHNDNMFKFKDVLKVRFDEVDKCEIILDDEKFKIDFTKGTIVSNLPENQEEGVYEYGRF